MEKIQCPQCSQNFVKRSHNSTFCSEICRRENRSGRSSAQSKNRIKHGELWTTARPAKPVVVKVPASKPEKRKYKISLILPDPQFGYRKIGNKLDPFHDEKALKLARSIAEYIRPDEAIFLGDVLDLAPYGRYRQEPGFVETVQPAIDRTFEELCVYNSLAKKVVFIQGNHDFRLRTYIEDNARAASSIHVATKKGEESDPVFSVQNLLRFKELNIEHIDTYPIGAYWINKELKCIHGHVVKQAGLTAPFLASKELHSTIFGHIHRIENAHATKDGKDGPVHTQAHSPGTLARIDGAVPSAKTSIDTGGNVAKYYENWQQGVSVVYSSDDGWFQIDNIPFRDGKAVYDKRTFK